MEKGIANIRAFGYADYSIKTYGARTRVLRFSRYPTVVLKAQQAIDDTAIVWFLIYALERPPGMSGLIFGDHRHAFPPGLPAQTPPIRERFYRNGYLVVRAEGGGLYVVAHWYFQNGSLRSFFELHS